MLLSTCRYPKGMRWLAVFVTGMACAQTFEIAPHVIQPGDTLHVRTTGDANDARLAGHTIRLFAQTEGGKLGLMPVDALQKPGRYTLEYLDPAGAVVHSEQVNIQPAHFPSQNVNLTKAVAELKPAPGEIEQSAEFRKLVSDVRYWTEPLELPIPGCMTSPFGVARLQNHKPTGAIHTGIDQRGAPGTPIHAVAGGVVKLVKAWNLHGNTVAIDHGQGLESMYLHMSKFATTEGAIVKKGDVIGYVGTTGRSTGPHLHWNLYVNGVSVNPAQWVELHACAVAAPPVKHKKTAK